MPSLNEISPSQLMRLLGGPSAPLILDVRTQDDFDDDPRLVPTTLRVDHRQVSDVAGLKHADHVVVICHKGKKLSHGAAGILRGMGLRAEVLKGGFVDWSQADLPLHPPNIPIGSQRATLWVTRHRPKIDRVACPWLIRRFIDPEARFLFVPPSEVLDVADRFSAIPFDVDDAPWTHHGAGCTFDALIRGFGLSHPPLDRMAEVIRAADTNRLDDAPQAAGLLALSIGLSRLHKEDQRQLDAAIPLYDALYRWARDGFEETHTHNQGH